MIVEPLRLPIDGVRYGVQLAGTGPPLLLLHGFTGAAATWMPHLPALTAGYRVLGVDLPGHGATDAPPDPARYALDRVAADLLAIVDRVVPQASPRFHLLGYSLGGRLALHLALAAPDRVRSLVLESASPGIADPGERATRRDADAALADGIEREGLSGFVDYWEALPLFASQRGLQESVRAGLRAQRLANSAPGLANSLRGAGAGSQASLWERLGELHMPALLLAGSLDRKYCTLAGQMAARMPRARTAIIEGAGHAVHLEMPERFDQLVLDFLHGGSAEHRGPVLP